MPNPGQILQERYRIVSELGRGGMGAVYKAVDSRLNIYVALKELTAQTDLDTNTLQDLRDQFRQEATILARLSHPHLVGVTDFFQEGRNVYLVMQYVEGMSLSDIIKRDGALREDQVLVWAAQLLDAISYIHSHGIIHRDIKPQNIIINPNGQAILVDFGLVKLWDPNDPKTRTAVRGIGTPQYSPPEQYETTAGHTGPRSDIFSLGATLYHALTGQSPPTATLRIASPEEYVGIRAVQNSVSPRTATVIERAMELARTKRWGTAAEMASGLGLHANDWGSPQTSQDPSQMNNQKADSRTRVMRGGSGKRQKRMPVWALVLGLATVAVIVGGALVIAGILLFDLQEPIMAMFKPGVTPTSTVVVSTTNTLSPTETPTGTTTSEPTGTATSTPTATSSPTATSETQPTATLTPTPTPTETPKPTVESTATSTQEVQPSPTTEVVSSGALIGFENFGTWQRGDQPYGEFVQSQDRAKDGAYSTKLTYDFPNVADDYVVFSQVNTIGGQPNKFSVWVYGDGSGHYLNLWIQDAANEMWSVHMGAIPGAGWQELKGDLVPNLPWPNGHISGPDNEKVDYPVRFYAFVLDRPASGSGKGTIYIDKLTAWSDAASAPQTTQVAVKPTSTEKAVVSPPPSGEVGRIIFTGEAGGVYTLYSTDPGWNQPVEIGQTDLNKSTCSGSTASTLAGQTFNLYSTARCSLTERTDVCGSPDAKWQLITAFQEGWTYAVLVKNVNTNAEEWYYQGKLNTTYDIAWSPNSQYVTFGVNQAVNVIRAGVGGYQGLIGYYNEDWLPQFSPDGSMLLYLKPEGSAGNSDAFIVGLDGSGEKNLTKAPNMAKLCPRWQG